jgi:outer membrane lipoprotein-sorting protein
MTRRTRFLAAILLACLPLSGCLFRSRKVENHASTAPLLAATQQELIQRVDAYAEQIKTLNAAVDIDTSVGGAKKGKVTDYREISGYILLRKPDMLRMIGLVPIVRTRMFDMVSNGRTFELWIPAKNKFYVGRNDVVPPGKTGLEALRPDVVYSALLVQGINPETEIAVLETGIETVTDPKSHKPVEQADYRLDVIARGSNGWYLGRKIIFSRVDLRIEHQRIYNQQGDVVTDASYSQYKDFSGVNLPSVVEIVRPQEEYDITIMMTKVTLNQPLTDQQFALAQPPGSQLVSVDQSSMAVQDGRKSASTDKAANPESQ